MKNLNELMLGEQVKPTAENLTLLSYVDQFRLPNFLKMLQTMSTEELASAKIFLEQTKDRRYLDAISAINDGGSDVLEMHLRRRWYPKVVIEEMNDWIRFITRQLELKK